MPAIRDYQFAFETVTTDGGITIPKPITQTNDLLLVFAMGDTGAPTWTPPTGVWNTLFATNNTVSTICYWRIADGTEGTSFTVGATVTETYNGICISVQDVNTTNPFGNPAVSTNTNQAAVAKFNMDQITTNVNNALVLYISANSNTGVPSLLEGPVFGLLGADGAAESLGVGWGFQATAGLTPVVTCSNVATGAGVKATIQIAPPVSGATIIPTYCATDNCTYLEPINGTTAYNSNTALAATADTNFGTSLGGFVSADATVAAAADVGINSFHSMGQLTSTTSATGIAGAELVFAVANRPNVTGKNLLCHVQASTPLQLQRTGSVGSNKGIWFGMRSGAATNYKIWQVLGADSPGAGNRPIPIIINEAAANTIASAGTLAPSAILSVGFWCNGSAVGNSVWQFGSLWLMDSTVVCGGNSTFPVNINGIVNAVAIGKERLSAIQQGANQMLLLQDVQIGNGGTNPTFLDLDATAIEFPSQRNTSTKQVNYNSINNQIGLTYHAGSADTIRHRNSVVSSPSRYKWGLHPSSSTSATYDFSGLSVIGAGTVTLNRAITVTSLTINDYLTLDVSNLTLSRCSILNVPSTNDSTTSNSTTSFSNCTINVSRVTSGNRWISVASPSIFTNCSFTGTASTGHAIRITTPGTYTFTGNQFTGFGASGTNSAAIFNDSGGLVTINIAGGGNTPSVRNGTGASTVVNNGVTVRVTARDANTLLPIENARVYVTATGGGPSPDGTVILSGTTNASGIIENTGFNFLGNQTVTGRVRRATTGTRYKTGTVTGTITSNGLDTTILLISDE